MTSLTDDFPLQTAKGMLKNFLSIVDRFGFIPNGGRIYYSMRSQPPLLTPMVKTYVDYTNDKEFAIAAVDVLAREFEYWMTNHTLTVKGHKLARYGDKSSGPRPESYREDIETGKDFANDSQREDHYSELKAAAESGMDFSSRWFINSDGENTGDLRDLKTRSIIPVELNAILHWNAKIIAEFYGYAGNTEKQQEYLKTAHDFMIVSCCCFIHFSAITCNSFLGCRRSSLERRSRRVARLRSYQQQTSSLLCTN